MWNEERGVDNDIPKRIIYFLLEHGAKFTLRSKDSSMILNNFDKDIRMYIQKRMNASYSKSKENLTFRY
jgi:hypothetical protein